MSTAHPLPGVDVTSACAPRCPVCDGYHEYEGATDLGVVWDAVDARGLQALPYRSDHLGVVMLPSHPLAHRERVRFADTLDHASVGVSPGGLLDVLLRRQAALVGRTMTQRMQVARLDAGGRIVAAFLGLAIVPFEAAAPQVASSRLVMLPLDEPWAERRFAIVARDDEWLSAAPRRASDERPPNCSLRVSGSSAASTGMRMRCAVSKTSWEAPRVCSGRWT